MRPRPSTVHLVLTSFESHTLGLFRNPKHKFTEINLLAKGNDESTTILFLADHRVKVVLDWNLEVHL